MCLQQCSPADARLKCMAVPQRSCTQMGRRRWPPLGGVQWNPLKIEVPKNIRFFIDFCLIFVICCKRQHRKFIGPANVLLAFHTFQFFDFRIHFFSEKPTKNPSKMRSEPFQNRCRKRVVFQHRFFRVSDSILEPLGPPRWSQVGHFGLQT